MTSLNCDLHLAVAWWAYVFFQKDLLGSHMPSIPTMGDGRDESLSFEYILRYWHVQRFLCALVG